MSEGFESLDPQGFIWTWDAFPNLEEQPRLLLGYRLSQEDVRVPGTWDPLSYPVTTERAWRKIAHQTAGVACHHVYLYVTELEARPEVRPTLRALAERYYDALGWAPPSLDEANTYRAFLRERLGVDCNHSYTDLEEAIYPIDADTQHIRRLSTAQLPDDLSELFDWDMGEAALPKALSRFHAVFHLRLYLVAENSD